MFPTCHGDIHYNTGIFSTLVLIVSYLILTKPPREPSIKGVDMMDLNEGPQVSFHATRSLAQSAANHACYFAAWATAKLHLIGS